MRETKHISIGINVVDKDGSACILDGGEIVGFIDNDTSAEQKIIDFNAMTYSARGDIPCRADAIINRDDSMLIENITHTDSPIFRLSLWGIIFAIYNVQFVQYDAADFTERIDSLCKKMKCTIPIFAHKANPKIDSFITNSDGSINDGRLWAFLLALHVRDNKK